MTIMGSACSKCLLYAKHGAKQLYELSHLISPPGLQVRFYYCLHFNIWGQWGTGSFKRCIICCFCILYGSQSLAWACTSKWDFAGNHSTSSPKTVLSNRKWNIHEDTEWKHKNHTQIINRGTSYYTAELRAAGMEWDASGMPGGTLLNARRNSHKECFWSRNERTLPYKGIGKSINQTAESHTTNSNCSSEIKRSFQRDGGKR